MFDKILGTIPLELLPELQDIARECEERFRKREFTAEVGMVRVTVVHPGKVEKIEIEDSFFNPQNKKLILDLIPLVTEKAFETMTSEWRVQLTAAGEKIKEIVSRFSESSNKEEIKEPTDSEDGELN